MNLAKSPETGDFFIFIDRKAPCPDAISCDQR